MGVLIETIQITKEEELQQSLMQTLNLVTPAFVYDEDVILSKLNILTKIKNEFNCKILFPLKTFSFFNALKTIAKEIDGFSASSLFEAKLAKEILHNKGLVHFTSPGLREDEIKDVIKKCDHISFNSLSQWDRFHDLAKTKVSAGLRINPELSFVKDSRCDPCRKFSKLGIPIDQLASSIKSNPNSFKHIEGVLIHSNCEGTDFKQLFQTVEHITTKLPSFFKNLKWFNIGGGYLFDEDTDLKPLKDVISLLNKKYNLQVFLEPGKGVIGDAGYIVSKVVDIFENDGKNIAVLDTSVNHIPEVFEYQFNPSIMSQSKNGQWQYILAGSTCLAGDLFGEFHFEQPLEIGSQIIFQSMGAYTLVKSHMFNGLNLPAIYAYGEDKKVSLKKKFNYGDFYVKCGGGEYVTL